METGLIPVFAETMQQLFRRKYAAPESGIFLFQRQACKPDSVIMLHPARGLCICSVIYLGTQSPAYSYDLPPGSGEQPSDAGIRGLSTHQVCGS